MKPKLTKEEVREANRKIRQDNIARIEAIPDLDGIRLKRIHFDQGDLGDCHHHGISKDRYYLVLMNGHWFLGRFTEQWYGWNFNGGAGAGCQLNHLQMVYETDLIKPDLHLTPYVKFVPTHCGWCDNELPEDKDEWCKDENDITICGDCAFQACG